MRDREGAMGILFGMRPVLILFIEKIDIDNMDSIINDSSDNTRV